MKTAAGTNGAGCLGSDPVACLSSRRQQPHSRPWLTSDSSWPILPYNLGSPIVIAVPVHCNHCCNCIRVSCAVERRGADGAAAERAAGSPGQPIACANRVTFLPTVVRWRSRPRRWPSAPRQRAADRPNGLVLAVTHPNVTTRTRWRARTATMSTHGLTKTDDDAADGGGKCRDTYR